MATKTNSLRRAVGSLLVVGLHSAELSALERAWLNVVHPGGTILFRRNIADVRQTRALLDEATMFCAPNAFRCVDVEGGTVDRLRDALAPTPSAQAVALAARKARKPQLAREFGQLIARGIKAFGFNTTLAPVFDLDLPESASVMGSRTTGTTPDEVTAFTREFMAGLAAEGVAGCGKHFPGLGGGQLDSHFETPRIHRSWKAISTSDLVPYHELRKELPIVMVNHAAYPDTPGKDLPATVSSFWITKVLRKQLGYRGIILSDDMEMGGILKFMPIEEAAVAAIRAGMDVLEICHSPELILRTYEALLGESERSITFRTLVQARAKEVSRKRTRLFASESVRPLNTKQFEALRSRTLAFRDKIIAFAGDASEATPNRTAAPVETA